MPGSGKKREMPIGMEKKSILKADTKYEVSAFVESGTGINLLKKCLHIQ